MRETLFLKGRRLAGGLVLGLQPNSGYPCLPINSDAYRRSVGMNGFLGVKNDPNLPSGLVEQPLLQ